MTSKNKSSKLNSNQNNIPLLDPYNINVKKEQLHFKTLRTFFFLHARGQECRISKIENELIEGSETQEQSQLVIEGIFETCDSLSNHLILGQAVILRVFGKDPYNQNARSELVRRAEQALVDMNEVKEMRFSGVNITKDGMQRLNIPESPQEVPPSAKIDPQNPENKESEKFEIETKKDTPKSQNKNKKKKSDQSLDFVASKQVDKDKKSRSHIVMNTSSTLTNSMIQDQESSNLDIAEKENESDEADFLPETTLYIDSKIEKKLLGKVDKKQECKSIKSEKSFKSLVESMKEDDAVVDVEEAVVKDISTDVKIDYSVDMISQDLQELSENKSPNIDFSGSVLATPPMSTKNGGRSKNRKKKYDKQRVTQTPKVGSFISKGDRDQVEKSKIFEFPDPKKDKEKQNRDLVRFKVELEEERPINSYEQLKLDGQLESLENNNNQFGEKYDQFANKSSTYDFNNYTSSFDKSKITKTQKKEAEKVAKEIQNSEQSKKNERIEIKEDEGHSEEMMFSAVQDTKKVRGWKVVVDPPVMDQEETQPEDDPEQWIANQPTDAFKNNLPPAPADDPEDWIANQSSEIFKQNLPQFTDFKKILIDKLAPTETKTNEEKQKDPRERINSLRNGETSKVIQTHNIDVPYLDKDACDKYQQFQEEQNNVIFAKDRKLSMEYFKEESKKITQKMDGKKKSKKGMKNKVVVAKRRFTAKHDTIDEQTDESGQQNCHDYSLEKHHFVILEEQNHYKERAFKETGDERNFESYLTKSLVYEEWPLFNNDYNEYNNQQMDGMYNMGNEIEQENVPEPQPENEEDI